MRRHSPIPNNGPPSAETGLIHDGFCHERAVGCRQSRQTKERTVFSIDMLRVIADEREREIQAELRRRRLVAPPFMKVRVLHRPARPRPKEER